MEQPKAGPQLPGSGPLPAPEGKSSPKERELIERRTANSATFAQADGTNKTVLSAGRMFYRDGQGKWQKPDNTLVADAAPGYALANKANDYRAQLPADLGAAPVKVSAGSDWVSFALDGAKGPPAAKDNRVEYSGALPGVDVSYSAQNASFKEALTLASPKAGFRFAFSVQASPGLQPTSTPTGPSSSAGVPTSDSSSLRPPSSTPRAWPGR